MKARHGIVLFTALLSLAPLVAVGGEVLTPPDGAPRYRLSNFRLEDDRFGKPNLIFDYTRLSEGKGRVQLAGRSADGELMITFAPNLDRPSGEVRLEKTFGMSSGGYNYEFYFVMPAYWAGQNYGNCLVSNTVRMGNPGPSASARAWTAKERAAYEKQQLADKPPEGVPADHQAVHYGTKLVPGMPIMAGRYGEWAEAEVLALGPDEEVTLRFVDEKTATTRERVNWLAATDANLRLAASDPSQFQPSMRVLPGGKHALPDDAEALAGDLKLPAGTPLLLNRGSSWKNVRVSVDKGDTLNVLYSWHRGFDWDHKRSELAIRRETLEELKQPGAADRYAAMLDEQTLDEQDEDDITVTYVDKWDVKQTATYHIFDKDYPISVRVPRGAQQLPEELEIPVGTPVAYCWARKWHHATLLADRQSTVLFKEDDSTVSFAYKVPREQLIIQDKTLRKIRSNRGERLKELQQLLRTWTDATGQHKIEARFASLEDDVVTLKSDTGREIKLPLEKLSDEDQELLKGVGPGTDNPFE